MNDDLSQYLDLFESEGKGYIQTLNNTLVELEKNPNDPDLLYTIMRISHTLKGMMGIMSFNNLMTLCHKMEDFFDAARKGKMQFTKDLTGLFFNAIDAIDKGIDLVIKGQSEPDTTEIVNKLQTAFEGGPKEAPKEAKKEKTESEEVEENAAEIKEISVGVDRLDKMMALVEELIVSKMHLNDINRTEHCSRLGAEVDNIEKIIDELQYNVTQARMVAVGYLFNRFPRMIRDMASSSQKDVDLEITGSDIKMDRSIIDELSEPLIHLLRNSVDHGIEKKGKIKLHAKRDKNAAMIEISDDGRGLDLEMIKKKAIEGNIIPPEEAQNLTEKQVMELIFDPVLSTSEKVTDASGRGVGMSAVKNKVEALNGSILIESEPGKGTKFTLVLPLSLAIIKSLLVRVNDEIYAIPVNNIDRNVNFEPEKIKKAGDEDVAILEEDDIPLLYLRDHFSLGPPDEASGENTLTVIVNHGEHRLGLVVDELVKEEEIIVKNLASFLKNRKEFSGVTVLGDGQSVLILDINNLI